MLYGQCAGFGITIRYSVSLPALIKWMSNRLPVCFSRYSSECRPSRLSAWSARTVSITCFGVGISHLSGQVGTLRDKVERFGVVWARLQDVARGRQQHLAI